jgi:4-diphosphocytidyl-2-C-methyl-D-erythritol kinase
MSMISFPNAKINIGLNIIEKRADGFNNIESIFYPVGWKDALEVVQSDSFKLDTTGLEIPGKSESNLIFKAYQLMKPHFRVDQEPHFHLHKVIPMGAGLGGGSADGAFALSLLNEVFDCQLSGSKLHEYAAQLGSDCPFFVVNKPSFVFDRGVKFEQIDLDLSNYFIILVNPNIHIGTKEAYAGITPKKPQKSLLSQIKQPIATWKESIQNDFEESLLLSYPKVAEIKKELYQTGALYASMTGSGSTVYGIFEKEINLKTTFSGLSMWQGPL